VAVRGTEDLIDAIRARGGRVTPQRRVIVRYLLEQPRHVTAEQLLAAVEPTLPGVALPTVYATLELLSEHGLVRRLDVAGGAAVYDSRRDPHHHVRCRRCGAVEDLSVAVDLAPALAAATAAGFAVERESLTLTGLCAACRSAESSPAPVGAVQDPGAAADR